MHEIPNLPFPKLQPAEADLTRQPTPEEKPECHTASNTKPDPQQD